MYKVLIAEDEGWIRKSIKKMIRWENLELTLADEACDGQEAFEKAIECEPHILITDVRMPGMNGLDLATKLSKAFPNIKIVIISGFDEFEYVKRAIDIDAVSYILKPINEEELNSVLKKAVKEIYENINTVETQMNSSYLTQKLVSDVIHLSSGEYLKRYIKWLKSHHLLNKEYAAAIIHFDPSSYDIFSMQKLFKKSADQIYDDKFESVFFEHQENKLGALVFKKQDSTDCFSDISMFFKRLWLIIKKENISGSFIAVGDMFTDPEQVGTSYSQAITTLYSKNLNLVNDVIFYSAAKLDNEPMYPLDLQKNIITALILQDKPKLKEALLKTNDYFLSTSGFTLKHAKEFFATSATDIVKVLLQHESFDSPLVEEGFLFCSQIDQYFELSSLMGWMNLYSTKVLRYLENFKANEMESIVLETVDYIKNNFHEDITLNMLATKYHINSGYLSTMFKKKVDESFVKHLSRIRIEKSGEYLASSNVSISQIAGMVGYEDVRYFGKVFKKHYGKTPSEYRADFLEESD